MSTHLEIESKSMLTKQDYKKLMSKFSHIKNYTQINYYIFSDEMLKHRSKYGLRMRKKEGYYELTLKVKVNDGRNEINQEISKKTYKFFKKSHVFPDGEVKDYLIENGICDPAKLRIVGSLKTIRKDIKFMSSLISVDKSSYNHKVDYEVECEDLTPIAAQTNLEIFLQQNLIKFKKSEYSKLARFLNSK